MSAAADTDHPEAKPGWHPPALRWPAVVAITALAVAALLAVLAAFDLPPFASSEEMTDNAYVRGRTTVIAPQVSGYVMAVTITDYAQVKAGQVLVRIDDSIYRARVEQARANLAAAIAALANNRPVPCVQRRVFVGPGSRSGPRASRHQTGGRVW